MKTSTLRSPSTLKEANDKPRVLLISQSDELAEVLKEVLPKQCEIIVESDPYTAKNVVNARPNIPIVADCSAKTKQSDSLSLLLHGHASNNTILISDDSDEDNLRFMFEHPGLLNLIPKSYPNFKRHLKISLMKKFGQKSLWGAGYYLKKGTDIERLRLYSFSGHGTILMSLNHKLSEIKAFSAFPDRVQTIAMELMMNAVLDAHPELPLKNHRRTLHTRNDAVKLNKSEEVFVEFGHDDENFVISTSDNHGTLKSRDAMQRLYRCSTLGGKQMRMTENRGAGIGFYLMYSWSAQLVFNLEPGKRTEVICILPISKREKKALPPNKALNFFIKNR